MTNVTPEKLISSRKRWNPEVIELVAKVITEYEFEERLAELGKLLYDEFGQRPKSQNLNLGTILKRTGTDD